MQWSNNIDHCLICNCESFTNNHRETTRKQKTFHYPEPCAISTALFTRLHERFYHTAKAEKKANQFAQFNLDLSTELSIDRVTKSTAEKSNSDSF